MVPGASGPHGRLTLVTTAPRVSRLWWVTGPLLALLIGAVTIVGALPVPYVALSPGSARSVEPLIELAERPGGPSVDVEPPTENLLFVTVSTSVKPSGLYILLGWLDDTVQVEPSAPFLGTQTQDENRALNLALMTDSQDSARKVALEQLGYEVEATPVGVFIEDVDPASASATVLTPGMTVVGVEGKEITIRGELVAAIGAKAPGDQIVLDVVGLDDDSPDEVVATLGERPGSPGEAILGISIVDRATYKFPIDIQIDTGKVGGPSAGLAFTLAILDRLTPGSITGDDRVAITGTIELDGSVGPVGGVRHKTEAAVREGAKLFLVPPDEFEVAKMVARGRIDIVSVASLDDALAALEASGGSGLPPVPE